MTLSILHKTYSSLGQVTIVLQSYDKMSLSRSYRQAGIVFNWSLYRRSICQPKFFLFCWMIPFNPLQFTNQNVKVLDERSLIAFTIG